MEAYGSPSPLSEEWLSKERTYGSWKRVSIAPLDRSASKGQGRITDLVSSSDALLLGTSRGAISRYDLGQEAETSSQDAWMAPACVTKLFVDPAGKQAIVTCSEDGKPSTIHHVFHGMQRRARTLSRLKGHVVTSVGWNRKASVRTPCTSFLMGTSKGALFECVVEDGGAGMQTNGNSKKEKVSVRQVGTLKGHVSSVIGLHIESFDDGKQLCVIVGTATRLYVFQGGSTLEQVFCGEDHFVEMPAELLVDGKPHSELHVSLTKNKTADTLVWLTGDGLYYGRFGVGRSKGGDRVRTMEAFITDQKLIPYPTLQEGSHPTEDSPLTPISAAVTEYHYLLLYKDRILALNRVSEELVFNEYFNQGLVALVRDEATGAVYSFNESTIFEIILYDEGQDMWEIYLRRKEWYLSIQHCRTQGQKDTVYSNQADEAFSKGDVEAAAALWARCSHIGGPRFEEIALRLIRTKNKEALSTYLLRKLDNLPKSERLQRTMLATWLLELYLDAAYQEEERMKREGLSVSEGMRALDELKDFMTDQKQDLDNGTTIGLLASYGRVEELVYYATMRGMNDVACMYMIQEGNAKRAIAILRHPAVPQELWYKFGPELFLLSPKETVDAWLVMGKHLDPKQLLPALLVCEKQSNGNSVERQEQRAEAKRYLEAVIFKHKCKDMVVHNLLLWLLCWEDTEKGLLYYLSSATKSTGEPYYDVQYALRLCLERSRLRSCCHLYATQGMYREAVSLALTIDLDLAKSVASMPTDDEGMRRKLWLQVARHIILQDSGCPARDQVGNVVAFLKETDGLLKLEDILPFFSDSVLIDDLKGAIGDALEEYSQKIEELKHEMDVATREAEVIRREMQDLPSRSVVLDPEQCCSACRKPIVSSCKAANGSEPRHVDVVPLFVFPCTHTFHEGCLLREAIEKQRGDVLERLLDLRERLEGTDRDMEEYQKQSVQLPAGLSSMGSTIPDGEEELEEICRRRESYQIQANEIIASECPYCTELMVGTLKLPLLDEKDRKEMIDWSL